MFRGSFVSSNFVAKLRTESKELRSSDITSTCERGLRTMRREVARAYKKELRLHNVDLHWSRINFCTMRGDVVRALYTQ
jgi:hypothetical protein